MWTFTTAEITGVPISSSIQSNVTTIARHKHPETDAYLAIVATGGSRAWQQDKRPHACRHIWRANTSACFRLKFMQEKITWSTQFTYWLWLALATVVLLLFALTRISILQNSSVKVNCFALTLKEETFRTPDSGRIKITKITKLTQFRGTCGYWVIAEISRWLWYSEIRKLPAPRADGDDRRQSERRFNSTAAVNVYSRQARNVFIVIIIIHSPKCKYTKKTHKKNKRELAEP